MIESIGNLKPFPIISRARVEAECVIDKHPRGLLFFPCLIIMKSSAKMHAAIITTRGARKRREFGGVEMMKSNMTNGLRHYRLSRQRERLSEGRLEGI